MDSEKKIIVLYKIRLDKFLSSELMCTRSQITRAVKDNMVLVNDKLATKSGIIVNNGDVVTIKNIRVSNIDIGVKDVKFNIDTVYENDEVLVINKPINLVVHPAKSLKNEVTLLDWLKMKNLKLSNVYGKEREGIVHRLDRGTSGALAIAKSNDSHLNLSKQLKNRSMGRYYLCIIDQPLKGDIIVDKPIGRNRNNRLKMGIVKGGKEAKSKFIKLFTSNDGKYELILCKLYSGRTHQIRVHLSSLNRHIINDITYGTVSDASLKGMYLHACYIYFYSLSGEKISISVKLPDHFKNFLKENFELKEYNNETTLYNYIYNYFIST